MPRNTSGLKRGGPGRPKGATNKASREVKAWAQAMVDSPEWQKSAMQRILAGKAPHIEAHCLQVLMPKTEKHEHMGAMQVVVSRSDERL